MMIDGWKCSELYPGEEWHMREAVCGNVVVTADADGMQIDEGCNPYLGASGRVDVPANVLVWLRAAVR